MTDRATRICDELRISREEAIFYLEGFEWDLDAAMEACRSKTLNFPSLTTVESPPEKEESSSEVRSAPPSTTDPQSINELIAQFYNFAVGPDLQDATSYLERNDWDLQPAVSQFCDDRRSSPSQRKPNRKLGRLNSHQYLQDGTSAAVGTLMELMRQEQVPKAITPLVSSHLKVQESTSLVQDKEEKLSPVKESAEEVQSSMSSSQLMTSPEEQLSQWEEESIKSFFKVAIGASQEAAIACLSRCKWNQDDAISYFFGDYTEAIQDSTSLVEESAEALSSSMSLIQLTDSPEEQLSRLKEESIKAFRDVGKAVDGDSSTASLEEASGGYIPEAKSHVKIQESLSTSSNQLQNSREHDKLINIFVQGAGGVVTRDVATVYLTDSNWNVDKAFSCLLKETSQVQASHGSPNNNYFEEDETVSSSCSSDADPTETRNVTAAIPGVEESSQVDENVKDQDVEEELSAVPITTTTIELEIILHDGESGTQVWILVRSDQTVRDIHNRVDAFRPDDNRDYYLKSDTGVEYRDLDTTVHSITSGSRGSTILHQLYSS
ncbi:hypothetical protein Bca52824_010515 [Brassica carinata]|uniref:Uncharacterized protein n=1 Tax=Brassica carinata TaxID=52824 RepID=A0A8X8BAS3_BRACI|nr:hypothetical protein Bca52824_010515 [Brassica carinata]